MLTPIRRGRLLTGLCLFMAVEFLLWAPAKFYPGPVLGFPTYTEKFAAWGFPPETSYLVGAAEIFAGVMLLLPRRRFLGAGVLVVILIGAVVTHVINQDSFVDSFSAPLHLVLATIVALAHWPADWREPLALGGRQPGRAAAARHGPAIHRPTGSGSRGSRPQGPG